MALQDSRVFLLDFQNQRGSSKRLPDVALCIEEAGAVLPVGMDQQSPSRASSVLATRP